MITFKCEKLHLKLSVAACKERHRMAHQRRNVGSKALQAAQYERCRGCELGADHRKGVPTPPELLVTIIPRPSSPVSFGRDLQAMTRASPYAPRFCSECGETFKPRGGRHRTCDTCKGLTADA